MSQLVLVGGITVLLIFLMSATVLVHLQYPQHNEQEENATISAAVLGHLQHPQHNEREEDVTMSATVLVYQQHPPHNEQEENATISAAVLGHLQYPQHNEQEENATISAAVLGHLQHPQHNEREEDVTMSATVLVYQQHPPHNEQEEDVTLQRRTKVKQMMEHAWDNYVRFAWGKNELRPISMRGNSASIFGSTALGATIVDSLDTLYIMGMMDEYKQGRDWIAENLNISTLSTDLSVFETNVHFVGGLLACFALTGDVMFRDKAAQIAEKLLPAFQTQTGIPNALVNFKTGVSKNYGWASGACSILAEFGTLHLEFSYLSDVTGNPVFRAKVDHIRRVIQSIDKPRGLYPNYFNQRSGKWGQYHVSIGGLGDSFYEYLLKAWLQSGREDQEARQMFDDAMHNMIQQMLKVSPGGLTYFAELKFGRLENKMDHLACFSGGLFGLAAQTLKNNMTVRYMEIAEGITRTCHESYDRTATKLGPEAFRFSDSSEAEALKSNEKNYILRPEVIESYFIMWRLTKEQKYRDWGWEAVLALEKHCRVAGGYTGLMNVYLDYSSKDDVQRSFFLAETLKYLYLLFSDDSLLSLDEWVYNTRAHPLPIKGVNPLYREQVQGPPL